MTNEEAKVQKVCDILRERSYSANVFFKDGRVGFAALEHEDDYNFTVVFNGFGFKTFATPAEPLLNVSCQLVHYLDYKMSNIENDVLSAMAEAGI